jgi:ATP phosphoribosyltransferase regulatory subunit HisZ
MLGAYGMKAAAAGFAFNLDRVMAALLEQGATAPEAVLKPTYQPVYLNDADPARAFIEASELRAEGQRAVLMSPRGGDVL